MFLNYCDNFNFEEIALKTLYDLKLEFQKNQFNSTFKDYINEIQDCYRKIFNDLNDYFDFLQISLCFSVDRGNHFKIFIKDETNFYVDEEDKESEAKIKKYFLFEERPFYFGLGIKYIENPKMNFTSPFITFKVEKKEDDFLACSSKELIENIINFLEECVNEKTYKSENEKIITTFSSLLRSAGEDDEIIIEG